MPDSRPVQVWSKWCCSVNALRDQWASAFLRRTCYCRTLLHNCFAVLLALAHVLLRYKQPVHGALICRASACVFH